MSFVKVLIFLAVACVQKTCGRRGLCGPTPQTDVMTYLEEDFFDDDRATFCLARDVSGVLILHGTQIQRSAGPQTAKAFTLGIVGYVHYLNGSFYYFPTFGCVIKPYVIVDTDDKLPNYEPVSYRALLRVAIQLEKPFPYCIPCGLYSAKQSCGFSIQLPVANLAYDMSNTQGGYIKYVNRTGSQIADGIRNFARTRGYKLAINYNEEDAIFTQIRSPSPPKCKRSTKKLFKLSQEDIAIITSLRPGSACYWAGLFAEYQISSKQLQVPLVYVSYGISKGTGCNNGVFHSEGYVPSAPWSNLFDPILFSFCI